MNSLRFHKKTKDFKSVCNYLTADEWADQFMRSLPLLVIPMLIPVNMDMMFIQYGMMFYGYGVYLHWGYEHPKLSSHNK